MRQALDVVHNTIENLQEGKLLCSQACDTSMLGALVKTLHGANLTWPRTAKPFPGVSFVQIVESVNQAQAQVALFVPGLSLNGPRINQLSKKRKVPNTKTGQALTPGSSREAQATFGAHDCDARRHLVEKLDELEGQEVEGREQVGYSLF